MKKINIIAYTIMIFASLLGIYAQDISYYIKSYIEKINPIYILTIVTLISIFLFVITPLLVYKYIKKQNIKLDKIIPYLVINMMFAFIVSFWSLFVLSMWWH